MEVIYNLKDFEKYRFSLDSKNISIGFVPTMGALHKGHLSLIETAKKSCDVVIVSIFVNPTQFNDPLDLENYPREIEADIEKLSPLKPDFIFIPTVKDIYPEQDTRQFDFGQLEKVMEGASRPGHFNGVAQVVSRLFDIVRPDKAFFGQKDFQQLAIIKSLVQKLNYNIEIIPCPIIRETSGLAMSSRNGRLSEKEKKDAAFIYKVLREAKDSFPALSIEEITRISIDKFKNHPSISLVYFEIVDSDRLTRVQSMNDSLGLTACVAVEINTIRLIDNLIFV